jgi:hypothetical protein
MIGGKYNEEGKYESGVVYDYKFNVVSSGSDENRKFFASTPTGTMQFSSVRDDLFEIGKEYYSDLTPAG